MQSVYSGKGFRACRLLRVFFYERYQLCKRNVAKFYSFLDYLPDGF
mgnify:CR=1 FL=1